MTLSPTQGVIWDLPIARRSDPATSHEAAHRAKSTAETNRAYALRVLRNHPEGLTDFRLAEITGISQTSIGVRRGELVKVGLVVDSGRCGFSPSGSRCIIWKAVA